MSIFGSCFGNNIINTIISDINHILSNINGCVNQALTTTVACGSLMDVENDTCLTKLGNVINYGTIDVDYNACSSWLANSRLSITGSLTNSGAINIGPRSGSVNGTSSMSVCGALDNKGTLTVANWSNVGNCQTKVSVGSLATQGTINLGYNAAMTVGSSLSATLTGTFNLNHASMAFNGGGLTCIAQSGHLVLGDLASITVGCGVSALSNLNNNSGYLGLDANESVSINNSLTNTGILAFNYDSIYGPNGCYGNATSQMNINGDLNNCGTIKLEDVSTHTSTLNVNASSELDVSGTLNNSGNLSLLGNGVTNGVRVKVGKLVDSGSMTLDSNCSNDHVSLNAGTACVSNTIWLKNNSQFTVSGSANGSGNGVVNIDSGSTASFGDNSSLAVNFWGAGELIIGKNYSGTVYGYGPGAQIDLKSVAYSSNDSYNLISNGSGNYTLQIDDNCKNVLQSVALSYLTPPPPNPVFSLSNDGSGHVMVHT